MGIAGTGMAAVAGLMREMGHQVSGSDGEIYPPMSTMLADLGIPVRTPYDPANLEAAKPDLVVVANALSRGHPELEALMASDIPYTSFPDLLGTQFLEDRTSIVVAGTHGKTTTSTLMSHVLSDLGQEPGYMVGGLPQQGPGGQLDRSFRVGKGPAFVIEGDEYDTAWFDKESKFLHYRPKYVALGNIEFDHADIFADLAAVRRMFAKLLNLCPDPGKIVVNVDDPGVAALVTELGLSERVCKIGSDAGDSDSQKNVQYGEPEISRDSRGRRLWSFRVSSTAFGELSIQTRLTGYYNQANIAVVIGCLSAMAECGDLPKSLSANDVEKAIASFPGVSRRFEHLGTFSDIEVYEDFAHHPSAVKRVIESFRKTYPDRRLIVAFEPRNATARRNVFEDDYAAAFAGADGVLFGKCPVDTRIPEDERMDIASVADRLGDRASAFAENEDLLAYLQEHLRGGESVVFMSSGSFSGIQHLLAEALSRRPT